ncbi:MAG: HAMP domain-containing protein [Treponema sp.]|nr:HAMP domain-containing protein [Treponema sp.]
MGSNEKKNKERSMIFKLVFFIGLTIVAINTVQLLIVQHEAKKSVATSNFESYAIAKSAYSEALVNKIEGYFKDLDFYVNSDIMKTGSLEQMGAWLIAHESVRNADFDYIMLAGPDGLAYTDIGKRTDIKTRSYFTDIMNGKDKSIDNPVISKTTGKPVIHVTRAIKQNGKTVAMLAGVLNIEKITALVNNIKIGESGYAWMLASDGTVMSHPVSEYVMNKNFITGLSEEHEDMAAVAKKVAAGETGEQWIKDLKEGRDLITYTDIQGTPWGLAISIPQSQMDELTQSILHAMITFALIAVIATVLVAAILIYISIKPLQIVRGAITGIASGNADLTKRIEINSHNEIGHVVNGFNKFTEKLQDIIRDVKNSKEELSIAGEDMSASAQDTASAITQIIANIESVKNQIIHQGASVEETAGAVNQIASNIASLENMIETQSAGVAQASAAVEEMIGNIVSVSQSVEKMAASFENLEESAANGIKMKDSLSEKMKQISEQSSMLNDANATIASIAEQTNLLAMNAAIEAAHAGEAGKGFSVVADEIRKLSETSGSQSRTIGEQLKGIQDTITTITSVSQGVGDAFNSLSDGIQGTDQLVLQIKAAMEEQNTGSQQISEALHNMNDSTIEVRNASQEMTDGNKAILEEVRRLQDATVTMKDSMTEMSTASRKINETGEALKDIANQMKGSIDKIGNQIDQFKV